MKIERIWAMPSHETFKIKPIAKLLQRYREKIGGIWIDPFAGNNSPAEITNDHNPDKDTMYHLEAEEFVNLFEDNYFDVGLFDPPYSFRQVSEHYKVLGKKATRENTSTSFYSKVKTPLAKKIKLGGYCISFGWNSGGLGINRGFKIIEILLVPHGGGKNDTIVVVEQKYKEGLK
jgi:hypothetical protein